ncbi:Core-2/I-Branching enzyme [Bryocella elongata]|uniref:Peptide O-xylosyltransferase n=1 Tax=Bryocella elongata TaxID=863522 RepID=A0A1H5UGM4_9BACT|nr:beta-1,6-N-acetylglucosaminyltransferase [Bryocella elongata]SEF74190.1 Core-2/I-Branching enzyme [Bryocella elongata]
MQLAYLILGHAHPGQIIRMIERLRPSASIFVVHIDARADAAVYDELAAYAVTVHDVLLAPRKRCYWGTYGIMEAAFACISTVLASGKPFDYAVLLSGQDYPIKRPQEIAAFFAQHAGAEFVEAFPLDKPNRWTPQGGQFQAMARVLHLTVNFRSRTLHIPLRRRFYKGWEPHGGSQWWALSRAAVEWIDSYRRSHPALERYFRYVFIPDEAMIQTMLANSPFRERIDGRAIHYIDWERPNPKLPRTLDEEDFERLRASECLFGRKMHPEMSATLLERVDADLLG